VNTLVTALVFPDGPCGHPSRTICTDGLTGHVRVECSDCDRLAALRERREAFDTAAFKRVAELAGLTVDELHFVLRLEHSGGMRGRSVKVARVPTCVHCGEHLVWRGVGRPPLYCVLHMPRKIRYNARKRGDLRLAALPSPALPPCVA